jgi:predicted kinase
MLIAMAGLPASGKSAVAADLGRALGCAVLAVDPVEAAMWRGGISISEPTGTAAYFVAEALAGEQLKLGHDVIVDAVNGVEPAREQWRQLAARRAAELRFIYVQCSDEQEHRRRLEERQRGIEGLPEPSWESVLARKSEFPPWRGERLVLDSMNARAANLQAALEYLGRP